MKSIKHRLLLLTLGLLLLSLGLNTTLSVWVVNTKSQEVLIEKAHEQVYEMAKQAEEILGVESDPINALQEFVDTKAQQENVTYAIIIDKNVQAVAHSDHHKIDLVYEDDYTIEGATKGVKQFTRWYAEVQGIWAYDIMEPIYRDGELYGVIDIGVPESGIKSIVDTVLIFQIIVGGISFLIIGALMWWSIEKIIKNLKKLENSLIQTADLDFHESEVLEELIHYPDEVGHMAKGIATMRLSLRDIAVNIQNTSNELVQSSTTLSKIAEETVQTTDEINYAITDIANSTEEQANDTEKSVEQLEQLSNNIDDVIKQTEEIVSMTTRIDTLSNEGVGTVEQLSMWSERNMESSQQVSTIVEEVDKTSSDISSIVNTITEIASQTNLLALNASIESARVGEAGKGFAVVAEEIRKLSEQTSNATEEIREKISAIQEISKSAVDGIKESIDIVEENAKATVNTTEIFNTIKEAIDQTMEVANEVQRLSSEMNLGKDFIISSIQSISNAAVQTSAGTEEVSASAQEQLKSIHIVSEKSHGLNLIAERLRKEIERIKL